MLPAIRLRITRLPIWVGMEVADSGITILIMKMPMSRILFQIKPFRAHLSLKRHKLSKQLGDSAESFLGKMGIGLVPLLRT